MRRGFVVRFFCFLLMVMSFVVSSAVGSKSMALEEQLPEHFYWGLETNIFNDKSKKAYLKQK